MRDPRVPYLKENFHLHVHNPGSGTTMIPNELMSSLAAKAKSLKRTIVFPDATDTRAIQAARILMDKAIVTPILVGDTDAIQSQAKTAGTSLTGIRIVDPRQSEKLSDFSHVFFNLRDRKSVV